MIEGASHIVIHRNDKTQSVTRVTFGGEDVRFWQMDDQLVMVHIKESDLRGFKYFDIPLGVWINVLEEDGECNRGIEIFAWPDGERYMEITESIIVGASWDFNMKPKLFIDALVEAFGRRQDTLGDAILQDTQFFEARDEFPDRWELKWRIHIGNAGYIEEAISLANEVNNEIKDVQWQIIAENAPHLEEYSQRMPSGIFLSHSWHDKRFARKLASDLQAYGLKVWIDEAELFPGDSLIAKLQQAILKMDYLCVILSPYSTSSEWVQREVEIALTEEIQGKRIKVIPILYKKCDVPAFMRGKIYADCTTTARYKKALDNIIARVRRDRESASKRLKSD